VPPKHTCPVLESSQPKICNVFYLVSLYFHLFENVLWKDLDGRKFFLLPNNVVDKRENYLIVNFICIDQYADNIRKNLFLLVREICQTWKFYPWS